MGQVLTFAPKKRPEIPEHAHKAFRLAMRLAKRSQALQVEVKLRGIEMGFLSLAPTNVVPLRFPPEISTPFRMAMKYHRWAHVLLRYAHVLADEAGVPREGRSTPQMERSK